MRSIQQLMDLSGRVALVVGGAGHLGRAMSTALAEAGAKIFILDKDDETSKAAAQSIADATGSETDGAGIDLRSDEELKSVPSLVKERFGRLDILIHTAAMMPRPTEYDGWMVPFEKQDSKLWPQAMQVNLNSAFTLAQAAAPMLRESGSGCIINIISHYGLVAPDHRFYEGTKMANVAAYAASKGGLLQLSKWLSTTLAPDVRVNSITPGGIYRNHTDPFHARYKSQTPLGRMGTEEDFKGAILYLASDLSKYVTGHNLVVDGGITAW